MQFDLYSQRKKLITENIVVNFTSIGIANICDYAICDRFDDNYGKTPPDVNLTRLNNLKTGDRLFLNGFNLQNYPEILNIIVKILTINNVKLNFYIGVIEPVLHDHIVDILLPFSIKIYITNNVNKNCHILPIGLRDGEEVHPNHKNFSGKDIVAEMANNRDKKFLCLLCFTNSTNETRYDCENKLGNKSFVNNLNRNSFYIWNNKGGNYLSSKSQSIHCGNIPHWVFYKFCHESHYTLCPRGAGEDTHRFFEAIALHSIPIVKRTNTPFDKTFEIYPCIIINNWEEVTQELLTANLEQMQEQLREFHRTYPDFLTNRDTLVKMLDNIQYYN